ncbi:hypothetical protein FACS189432_00030 [Bacteroidia bacterium]|nr:hypothetical protein FACS189426_01570 [Bacteroidia bacterium]GHT26173.1 hypothetical protein FACS189432_00030 [Bacteroidia bacterium]
MKTRLFLVSVIFSVLTACSVGRVSEAQAYVSVYTNIPLAPNVVLTVETPIMAAPGPSHIWIDGYWTWDNYYREYVWVQGYWAVAPYVNAYWIPGYWEAYRGGYRWIDACWLPRDYRLNYGYYNGRYDYFGRPVYYHQLGRESRYAYTYSYDHRPEYRSKGYSSSPRFNEAPKSERSRITKEYERVSNNSRSSSTSKSRQETVKIRNGGDNNQRTNSTRTSQPATAPNRSTNTPNENTNNRRSNSENNNNSTRSRETQPRTNENNNSRSPQVRSNDNNSNNGNSNSNSRQNQGGNSRSSSSSSGSGRRN